jgi:digeranylgeranylglycerophospholipid reductase
MNKKHDVIVVGAGPVGSYTAYQLAKAGLDVGIFERNDVVGKDVNCTGIVSVECLRKFDLPVGTVLKTIDTIRAISPSGDYLRYRASSPIAHVVNRSLFDYELNRNAVREGATTYLSAVVEEIKVSDQYFTVTVNTGEEKNEFSARVGVIATGFELRSLHGLRRKPANFLFGIQTDVRMVDLSDVEVYFGEKVAPGSFGWVVPTNGAVAKVGLIAKENPSDLLKRFLRNPLLADRLQRSGSTVRCSPIPLRRIPKSYGERFVVVGEAAGQVKSTTGGGIYFGFLCSEVAAETILKAFRCGDYSERLLKEYEIIWRSKIEPELKAGLMLRNIFSKLSDRQIDFLMDLAKRDGVMPLIEKSHFDWHKDIISHLLRYLITKKLFGK